MVMGRKDLVTVIVLYSLRHHGEFFDAYGTSAKTLNLRESFAEGVLVTHLLLFIHTITIPRKRSIKYTVAA